MSNMSTRARQLHSRHNRSSRTRSTLSHIAFVEGDTSKVVEILSLADWIYTTKVFAFLRNHSLPGEKIGNMATLAPASSDHNISKTRSKTLANNLVACLRTKNIMPTVDRDRFLTQVARYQSNPPLDWSKVKPLAAERITTLEELDEVPSDAELVHLLLDKVCVVKLNGGLGTSMGCRGPKSAIEVKNEQTFLDLAVRQVESMNIQYGADVPLILMNSFNTHEETEAYVKKYETHNIRIIMFNQSCYPRIDQATLLPLPQESFKPEQKELWCPGGHGDIYAALYQSGILENLINQGKEFVFISNIDNLCATVDLKVLYQIMNSDTEFCMEVTRKTKADVKGGTLVEYDGKLRLVEVAEVAQKDLSKFLSVNKFKYFNTNNLWANLRGIQRLIAPGAFQSDVIVNKKIMHEGRKVIQLETAAGAAIKYFPTALALQVPRSRFNPVKMTSDLFLAQSNLYTIKHGSLIMNPGRGTDAVPLVKFGPELKSMDTYSDHFAYGPPDILELEHLTVSGDVYFGEGVVLKGTVIIVANGGNRIDIPAGSVLNNVVVSGALKIVEH
jgi:UTP--glucose-1-phosphate uridylyltransferase